MQAALCAAFSGPNSLTDSEPGPSDSAPPVSAVRQSVPDTPSSPAIGEWQAHWSRTLPELAAISRQLKPRQDVTIMRASQLDATRLDEELSSMLREQFLRAFSFFRPAAVARLQPELTLLLDFLIFRFSIWEGRPLPGMALMNLRYRNEAAIQPMAAGTAGHGGSWSSQGSPPTTWVAGGHSGVEGPGLSTAQRSLYCLGAVVTRYAWARLVHHAAAMHWGDVGGSTWRQQAWALMRRADTGYRLASLVNFIVFLRTGRYRSLLERLLRARLVYQQPSAARAISFEYLNRQLVWSEMSELLLFLLPLVNAKAIKHAVRSYLPRLPVLTGGAGAAGSGSTQQQPGGQLQQLYAQQPCGICGTADILQPWAAVPCHHRFCYYCLRSQCLADPQYSCPLCLQHVEAMQQLGAGDGSSFSSEDACGGAAEQCQDQDDQGASSQALRHEELSLAGWLLKRNSG